MSKMFNIRNSIVSNCKKHGVPLQCTLDINWDVMVDVGFADLDNKDDEQHQLNEIIKLWRV